MTTFIENTIDWYKGEAFEAFVSGSFGIGFIFIALLLWKIGDTQGARALIIPLVGLGLILGISGLYNANTNRHIVKQLENSYTKTDMAFIHSEKERVEGFQYLYTFTKYLATGLFAVALIIFFFTENYHGRAIAISMVILGGSGLVIDHFSKERADTYYQIILNEINK